LKSPLQILSQLAAQRLELGHADAREPGGRVDATTITS
jgi:hypothetical protein